MIKFKTRSHKADILTCFAISLALPAYYKVRFLLEGQLSLVQVFKVEALIEVLFAFLLAAILIIFYRSAKFYTPLANIPILNRFFPLLVLMLSTVISILFTQFFFNIVVDWGTQPSFLFDVALLALLLPLLISGIADRIFLKNAAKEAKYAELSARFEALKARVSPHFLFNSLNTLTDLVEQEPKVATQFIQQMSSVYRYILEHRDEELVPLQSEMVAMKALLALYETRLPGALNIHFDMSDDAQHWYIVPMTVQTLIENALKHNYYSASSPLSLSLESDQEYLNIENSLNLRKPTNSNQEGIESLKRRVLFICKKPIKVKREKTFFRVSVPLMRSTAQ